MNNVKSLVCALIILAPAILNGQGIKFEEGLTWKQIVKKAKDENKYIFVDCYATWCGPCKYMDQNVYSNDTVGIFFNDKFISVKVQMDSSKNDNDIIKTWYADAAMIQRIYKVGAFPTFLFFSPSGEIVHRDAGAFGPVQFVAVAENAFNPNKQYYTLLKKYRNNEPDTSYMKDLAYKAKDIEGEGLAHRIANEYINRLPMNILLTKENIQFMYEFTSSSRDRGFKLFRDSAVRISKTHEGITKDASKDLVLSIIYKEEIKPYSLSNKGKPDWKKIKSNVKKYGSVGDDAFTQYQPGIIFRTEIEPALKLNSNWNQIFPLIQKQNLGKNAEFVIGSTVVYYLNGVAVNHTEKNCKNLVAAATYYADSFPTFLNARILNSWAWTLFDNSNNKDELNKALQWSKRSLELEPGGPQPEELDTYANILYKLGSVSDAISWEEKAVETEDVQAKNRSGVANPVYRETLDKMKQREKTWSDK